MYVNKQYEIKSEPHVHTLQSRDHRWKDGCKEGLEEEQRIHAFAEFQQEFRHPNRELEDGEHRSRIGIRQRGRILRLSR